MIEPGFWPTSLRDWSAIGAFLAAAAGAIWGFLRRGKEINAVGRKVTKVEAAQSALEARMLLAERARDLSQAEYSNLRESMVRMSVQVQTLADLTQRGAVARAEELGDIKEKLGRIETQVISIDERIDRMDRRSHI